MLEFATAAFSPGGSESRIYEVNVPPCGAVDGCARR